MLRLGHLAVAHHHLGRPLHDGRDELGDVGAGVLIVGVGVDDDVGAEAEGGVDAGHEGGGEAAVIFQLHNVRCTRFSRRFGCFVERAVVDDERLDDMKAVDLLRNVAQRLRDRVLFVVGGDLNDKLHRISGMSDEV